MLHNETGARLSCKHSQTHLLFNAIGKMPGFNNDNLNIFTMVPGSAPLL